MILVYMTVPNIEEAKKISAFVVEKRLAAGANIFPEIHSIYHWKGKIEQSSECVCIYKTKSENFPALQEAIIKLHSYTTPCIIALPIVDANTDFAKWIKVESNMAN